MSMLEKDHPDLSLKMQAELLGISLKTLHNKLNKLRGRVPGRRSEEASVTQG